MRFGPAERRELSEAGFLHRSGAVAEGEVRAMRDRLWEELERLHGLGRDEPERWRGCRPTGFQRISRSDAFETARGAARRAVEALLPGAELQPGVQPLVCFPTPDADWTVPHAMWHLDLPPSPLDACPGLRVFIFLDAVEPRGGGTAVVAGSHRLVQHLARDAPSPLPSRRVRETLRRRVPWIRDLLTPAPPGQARARDRRLLEEGAEHDGIRLRVVELSGRAGDLVLMDLRVLHSLTPNVARWPRLVLGQVGHRRRPVTGGSDQPR